ncbi:MAG TPA: hypothetical protein VLR29_01945 [Flavobacterium sp.]|nr:hypothetical protein [Flavobacterium sp.]
MKKTVLVSYAALAILGLIAIRRKRKAKSKAMTGAEDGLLTHSASKLLHGAKRAAIKEFQATR